MNRHLPLSRIPLALAAVFVAGPALAQLDLPRPSPKATISQRVGITDVSVSYSRPGVKGRTIWGDLVPWDEVWRTGANEATTLTVSDDVTVNGQKLPAGTWAIATIPGREKWTIVFNRDKEMWGTYSYDEKKDLLRVTVTPEIVAEPTERMTFSFPVVDDRGAKLEFRWEKIRWSLDLGVDTDAKVVGGAAKAIAAAKADDWRTAYRAAAWCFDSGAACPEAESWLEKSLAVRKTYYNLLLQAKKLEKAGRTKEAIEAIGEAIRVGEIPAKEGETAPDVAPAKKLLAAWSRSK